MNIREMRLEEGWYIKNKENLKNKFNELENNFLNKKFNIPLEKIEFNLSILPHAGWYFTEELIFNNLKIIHNQKLKIDLIIIIGGHQDSSGIPIILNYDSVETPIGKIEVEKNLTQKITNLFNMKNENDYMSDNTIEIFFPFIKYFFPESYILCYYPPANEKAFLISDFIYNYCKDNNINFIAIGSADLTHYGPNYYFTPAGIGQKSFEWAKENDYKLINYCIKLDIESILENYENLKFTCSPNSVISIINFAKLTNKKEGYLLEYSNSYYKMKSSSFVGYASIIF